MRLRALSGPSRGQVLPLGDADVTLGTAPDRVIVHVGDVLSFAAEGACLRNGIHSRSGLLAPGDVLVAGSLELELLGDEAPPLPPPVSCVACKAPLAAHEQLRGGPPYPSCPRNLCWRCGAPRLPGFERIRAVRATPRGSILEAWRGGTAFAVSIGPVAGPVDEGLLRANAARLQAIIHPNVARVHAVEGGDRQVRYVRELVPGVTLGELASRFGPLPLAWTLPIARSLIAGARAAGDLVLSGIGPWSVALANDRDAKLLLESPATSYLAEPCGLAAVADPSPPPLAHLAPEVIDDFSSADERSLVYNVAALVDHALLARPPFPGKTTLALFLGILHEPPALPGGPIGAVLARAMAKSRDERFQTLAELDAALPGA